MAFLRGSRPPGRLRSRFACVLGSRKIHCATLRRAARSFRSPSSTRRHHSGRTKSVSRGIASSGWLSSISRSSVVPERGQAPMNSGRPGRPAYGDGSRASHSSSRGRQPGATVGGS
jgi:hypothetical protein